MKKICPTCGKGYSGLEKYCMQCGILLEEEPNQCSEQKTALCKGIQLPDRALFCPYCGSLTIYAKERSDGEW